MRYLPTVVYRLYKVALEVTSERPYSLKMEDILVSYDYEKIMNVPGRSMSIAN